MKLRNTVCALICILAGYQTLSGQAPVNKNPVGIQTGINHSTTPLIYIPPGKLNLYPSKDKSPMLAGESIPVKKSFSEVSSVQLLNNGDKLRTVRFYSPEAEKLGLILKNINILPNDHLLIYSPGGKNIMGAFTNIHTRDEQILSTGIIKGDTLILEYLQDQSNTNKKVDFLIEEIVYLYPQTAEQKNGNNTYQSGGCNVNINCPEGDTWQKQKRGIVRIILKDGNSWYYCTGSLINNTANDGRPFLLTANHCGPNSSEEDMQLWQFYFDYEYEGCINSGILSENKMLQGTTLRSSSSLGGGTDFKLLELNDEIPDSWEPYFNGWSREGISAGNGVGIHHPAGDAKKISSFDQNITTDNFGNGMQGGYWRVNWSETMSGFGVTEGGSSGSPLFNEQGLIVGTLTGGSASCSNPGLPDFYGKFSKHWTESGTDSTVNLVYWLDPLELDSFKFYGYDPNQISNFVFFEVLPKNAGTITGQGYYTENENVTISAEPNDGYEFLHWTDENGTIVSEQQQFNFIMPQTELNLIAHFTEVDTHTNHFIPFNDLVKIYPNPSQGEFSLEFKTRDHIHFTVTITDTNGKIIDQVASDNMHTRQDFNLRYSGVYFVIIQGGHSRFVEKIVVIK